MIARKHAVACVVALAVASTAMPVLAGLTVVEKQPPKSSIPPAVAIDDAGRLQAENDRLNREIERLRSELAGVQADLAHVKGREQSCTVQLARINQNLDQIEREMETVGKAIVRVSFASGSARFELSAQLGDALAAAGKRARRIDVRGHADNTGTAEANRAVSLARALAAKRYLTGRGVDSGKVFVFSRAASEPVGDNRTEEGRAQNRRVEVEFAR